MSNVIATAKRVFFWLLREPQRRHFVRHLLILPSVAVVLALALYAREAARHAETAALVLALREEIRAADLARAAEAARWRCDDFKGRGLVSRWCRRIPEAGT